MASRARGHGGAGRRHVPCPGERLTHARRRVPPGLEWTWLIGHFVDAWLRVHGDRATARGFLTAFGDHLTEAGIGTISEIFDAEAPHVARGCIAQARSVAEVLRAILATEGVTE